MGFAIHQGRRQVLKEVSALKSSTGSYHKFCLTGPIVDLPSLSFGRPPDVMVSQGDDGFRFVRDNRTGNCDQPAIVRTHSRASAMLPTPGIADAVPRPPMVRPAGRAQCG